MEAFPRDTAVRLCDEIRMTKEHKPFSQRWGCVRLSKDIF